MLKTNDILISNNCSKILSIIASTFFIVSGKYVDNLHNMKKGDTFFKIYW